MNGIEIFLYLRVLLEYLMDQFAESFRYTEEKLRSSNGMVFFRNEIQDFE